MTRAHAPVRIYSEVRGCGVIQSGRHEAHETSGTGLVVLCFAQQAADRLRVDSRVYALVVVRLGATVQLETVGALSEAGDEIDLGGVRADAHRVAAGPVLEHVVSTLCRASKAAPVDGRDRDTASLGGDRDHGAKGQAAMAMCVASAEG